MEDTHKESPNSQVGGARSPVSMAEVHVHYAAIPVVAHTENAQRGQTSSMWLLVSGTPHPSQRGEGR